MTSLLVIMWFLFGEVSSSSGCLGWAAFFYCGTPRAFHIIILMIVVVQLVVFKLWLTVLIFTVMSHEVHVLTTIQTWMFHHDSV